jgi:alkane 1-monooxygenase
LKSLKYSLYLLLPLLAFFGFNSEGILAFTPLLFAFGIIPLCELLFTADTSNLRDDEVEKALHNPLYDLLVYIALPIQYFTLYYFCFSISTTDNASIAKLLGCIFSMGIMCAVFGINVAHELGHRSKWYEKAMAKALLLTSLYMHFYIEHNKGHHKNVGTYNDPATARMGETLYAFWIRTITYTYLSAWKIEADRLKRKKRSVVSPQNEMLQFQCLQMGLVLLIAWYFSVFTALCFIAAALIGILLLETVNYIEHYGLKRKKVNEHRYENAQPQHSWNSNHILGRLMLFELSRHSDHHYIPSKKYQILNHYDQSPQMPTGYPGMMLLATIPPLWFALMHKQKQVQIQNAT